MTSPGERLAALGLTLPSVPAPAGSYVPAVRSGDLVFSSGQLPLVDGALPATGLVGREVSPDQARDLARTAALNALAAVAEAAGGIDRVARAVKVVGFVASDPAFTEQPAVIDGASALLTEVLGDSGRHARSAVGVAALPKAAPVEVEIVVELVPDITAAIDVL